MFSSKFSVAKGDFDRGMRREGSTVLFGKRIPNVRTPKGFPKGTSTPSIIKCFSLHSATKSDSETEAAPLTIENKPPCCSEEGWGVWGLYGGWEILIQQFNQLAVLSLFQLYTATTDPRAYRGNI